MGKAGVSGMVVGFDEALQIVLAHAAGLVMPATEVVSLLASGDRVLGKAVRADEQVLHRDHAFARRRTWFKSFHAKCAR